MTGRFESVVGDGERRAHVVGALDTVQAGPSSRFYRVRQSQRSLPSKKEEKELTESSNGIDNLVTCVSTDLEESGLEGGLLTEKRTRSIDLDVSNRSEMTIPTRCDDGGGLSSSHHSESGSSRSSRHSEGSEGLSLSGELNRGLESDDRRRTKEDGRSSSSSVEQRVDIVLVEGRIEAFDVHLTGECFEGKLSFRDEGSKVGRSSRCADRLDPRRLGKERRERDRVVGGSCSRHLDIVGKSRGNDGCGGSGCEKEGEEGCGGSEHDREE